MSIRLVAAAKGLAVGVLTLCVAVAGAFGYVSWVSSGCPAQFPDCNAGLEALEFLAEGLILGFVLLLVVGPLLAWAFRLRRPAPYLIAPFLTAFVDFAVLPKFVNDPPWRLPLLVAPFVAYPVIAALSAGRRGKAPALAPSPGSPASP